MLTFTGIHKTILDDTTPEIYLEGARMCGKSWVFAAKVHQSCLEHPGIWWLICRYSGTETNNQLRPLFMDVCRRFGGALPEWHDDESAYWYPERDGKISKVFAYGLKAQSKDERYAKIRGSGVGGLWSDQTEEKPEDICTEMRALLRQPGYTHQLLLSPNPCTEDSYLADQFPDEGDLPGRKRYRLSLYDNKHNLSPDTIEKLERAYPPTHAKHRSLILGLRGPNITGKAVYEDVFNRAEHVGPVGYDPTRPVIEAIHQGQQHPVWLCGQVSYWGGFRAFGGVMGKRLFLDDFLEIVLKYRAQWFDPGLRPQFKTCCDPPPEIGSGRFSNAAALKRAGFLAVWKPSGSAPDVREAVIQDIAAMMHVRNDREGLRINADNTKWIMASRAVEKHTKLLIDGCEASYVWDEHLVSVGNKRVRQPKVDEWVDGWQRCLENIHLNFIAGRKTDFERDRERECDAQDDRDNAPYVRPSLWT